MAMKKITILLAILPIWTFTNLAAASHHHAAAPSPAVDCSTVILSMADCLSYVTSGSTVKKPEGGCCAGLKTVLKTDAECLCEGFKNSAQLGVTLNLTKAMALPSACHVSSPSASNCGINLAAGGAPALSPMPLSPSSVAGAPTTVAGVSELAPAPAPESSGSSVLGIYVVSLVLALVLASFSLF